MIRRILALAGLLAVAACANALAAPVTVDLRVEGLTQTLFEGPVTTDGHDIDGHPCDGTNGGVNPTPGPTMTAALDDSGIDWARTWFDGFQDFGIDRIGPDASDFQNNRFWGYALNFVPTQVGGCQQQVAAGDDVIFGYDFFNKAHLLKLSGPARAATGETVTVTVTDGQSGAPLDGAAVGGQTTGADGTAAVSFASPGVHTLKAERADSLRSNGVQVCVYEPGSGGCGTEPAPGTEPTGPQLPGGGGVVRDTVGPRATIAGLHDGRTYRRAPRVLRGRAEDDRGIHGVYLLVRMIDGRGCRWLSGRSETFSRPRSCDGARYIRLGTAANWSYQLPFELRRGARYVVDVKVLDAGLNKDTEQVRFRVAR